MAFLDGKAPTVLVVEDDDVTRETMVECLTREGYRVTSAENGAKGVRLALAAVPDVIVLDMGLPVMDGLEAMRRIRAPGPLQKVYVVMVSAFVNARDRQLAFEAGCNEYITKAAGHETVTAALRAYFVKRGNIVVEPTLPA